MAQEQRTPNELGAHVADIAACSVGWKYLFNASQQHYFVDGKSLCGKWLTFGIGDCTPDDGKPQSDECKTCRKKLENQKANADQFER